MTRMEQTVWAKRTKSPLTTSVNDRVRKGLLIALFILALFFSTFNTAAAQKDGTVSGKAQTSQDSSVHETLSRLSDEQVRQMLIKELEDDIRSDQRPLTLQQDIQGSPSPMGRLLDALNNQSEQSGNQLKQVFKGLPQFLPDLTRVFITL